MSELMSVPQLTDAPAKRTPTIYFIDDSATMREVIKIAFRRESFNVIACADAASALAQFEQNPPSCQIRTATRSAPKSSSTRNLDISR
jgi:DNA-binding NtrC family response regulator